MKVHGLPIYFMRGPTAYEFQAWRFGFRIVYLRGGWWNRCHFWQRISFQWWPKEEDE